MQQSDPEPLITKPVSEEIAPGVSRPSWPAPWLTGEHMHLIWRENVGSDELARKRAAADLFIGEMNARWIRAAQILVVVYKGDNKKISAGLKPLDDLEASLLKRYSEVFGEPSRYELTGDQAIGVPLSAPTFMQTIPKNSPNRPPDLLPATQMGLDMDLDGGIPLPKRQQTWRDRDGQDFKAV